MRRRTFLRNSLTASVAAGLGTSGARAASAPATQEFYELRAYRVKDAEKQAIVSRYLEEGLVPALTRIGIDRVGVFRALDRPDDPTIHVIIPYRDLDAFATLRPRLAADREYLQASGEYYAQPKNDPAFTRIESWLMKAFAGMPVIELPEETKAKKPRVFEVRVYESHSEDTARRKVEMFNSGEIQIMRDVKLGPVLYGETLVGNNVPNLTYMLSASDMEAHRAHWKAFSAHPEWARMKAMPRYAGTVSRITNFFLEPLSFSLI